MGKGKGSFDYWAARVAVSQVVFEIKGECHEQVVRDALRLAGNKLPGMSLVFSSLFRCLVVILGVWSPLLDTVSLRPLDVPMTNFPFDIGLYEFVKKGDPPVMGLSKMTQGTTLASMKNHRDRLPADMLAERLPASLPGPLPGPESRPSAQL